MVIDYAVISSATIQEAYRIGHTVGSYLAFQVSAVSSLGCF